MVKTIPLLDLMFFLSETKANPKHVAALILALPAPGCVVMLSPATDLTGGSASNKYSRDRDPLLVPEDSIRAAHKARLADVPVELEVWPDMPHVFQMMNVLPEARAAMFASTV